MRASLLIATAVAISPTAAATPSPVFTLKPPPRIAPPFAPRQGKRPAADEEGGQPHGILDTIEWIATFATFATFGFIGFALRRTNARGAIVRIG